MCGFEKRKNTMQKGRERMVNGKMLEFFGREGAVGGRNQSQALNGGGSVGVGGIEGSHEFTAGGPQRPALNSIRQGHPS